MRKLIQLLVLAVFVLLGTKDANAATMHASGTIQYTRNWTSLLDANLLTPPSLLAGKNTGVKPVKDMLIALYSTTKGGPYYLGWTDANGVLSATLTVNLPPASTDYFVVAETVGLNPNGIGFQDSAKGYRFSACADPTSTVTCPGNNIALVQFPGSHITIPASWSGTLEVALGTRTELACSPAKAQCDNDLINGHQVMQWIVDRWRQASIVSLNPNFEAAVARMWFRSDQTSNSQCGTGGGFTSGFSTGCFQSDFGAASPDIGFHEMGHELIDKLMVVNGATATWYGAQSCPGLGGTGGRDGLHEGFAELNKMFGFFKTTDFGAPVSLAPFCGHNAVVNDDVKSCTDACEFDPSLTSYPQPLECGTDEHNYIRRTRCKNLRVLVDLVDTVSQNGAGCLAESAQVTYAQLVKGLVSFPQGTGEGQVGETQVGGTSVGNALFARDAFGIMDLLKQLNTQGNLTVTNAYASWANGCYLPGDASWMTGTFLPAGGADNAPW